MVVERNTTDLKGFFLPIEFNRQQNPIGFTLFAFVVVFERFKEGFYDSADFFRLRYTYEK